MEIRSAIIMISGGALSCVLIGILGGFTGSVSLLSPLSISEAYAEPSSASGQVRRSEEMEFDARVIQGQRAEGAVYLFQRASRPLPPLLRYRRDYLKAIIAPVFGPETALGRAAQRNRKRFGVIVGSRPAASAAQAPANPVSNTSQPTPSGSAPQRRER